MKIIHAFSKTIHNINNPLSLVLVALLALAVSACGDAGDRGVATFKATPADAQGQLWNNNQPIAVGSVFMVEAIAIPRGVLTVESSDDAVITVREDGMLEAVGVGEVKLVARDSVGGVIDELSYTVSKPDRVRITTIPTPLGVRIDAPKAPGALHMAAGSELIFNVELYAGSTRLQHAGVFKTELQGTSIAVGQHGPEALTVTAKGTGDAVVKLRFATAPELDCTHGLTVHGNGAIDSLKLHSERVGGQSDGKVVMLVRLKARTVDGDEILGVRATWKSLIEHMTVMAPEPGKLLAAALLTGDVGKKAGLLVTVGEREEAFVVEFSEQ